MPRTKALIIPDTHVLKRLMEEYVEMLRETEKAVKKVLALNPQKEKFWDQLSEHAAEISMVEIRSKTIVEEIDDLINQLTRRLRGRSLVGGRTATRSTRLLERLSCGITSQLRSLSAEPAAEPLVAVRFRAPSKGRFGVSPPNSKLGVVPKSSRLGQNASP